MEMKVEVQVVEVEVKVEVEVGVDMKVEVEMEMKVEVGLKAEGSHIFLNFTFCEKRAYFVIDCLIFPDPKKHMPLAAKTQVEHCVEIFVPLASTCVNSKFSYWICLGLSPIKMFFPIQQPRWGVWLAAGPCCQTHVLKKIFNFNHGHGIPLDRVGWRPAISRSEFHANVFNYIHLTTPQLSVVKRDATLYPKCTQMFA